MLYDTFIVAVVDRILYEYRWAMVLEDIGGVREGSNSTTQIVAEIENLVSLYCVSEAS